MKFIIYTPPLNFKVGGTIVLYQLAKDLIDLNQDAKLYVENLLGHQNPFCNQFAKEADIDDETVVIYPEVVFGNPLKAKNVVRWMLCDLGVHTKADIYQSWGADDLIFHYSTFNNKYPIDDVQILYTTWIDPKLKNKNLPREGSCYLFKKASLFHKHLQMVHPADALLLDHFDNDAIIEIFHKKKYFYSYDPYSYYDVMALLCGCIPIIHPIAGLDKTAWLQTRIPFQTMLKSQDNVSGLAYGESDLVHAEQTLPRAEEELKAAKAFEQTTVKQLIHITENHFFKNLLCSNTLTETSTRLKWNSLLDVHEQANRHLEHALRQQAKEQKKQKKELEQLNVLLAQKEAEIKFLKSSPFRKLLKIIKTLLIKGR